MAQSAPNQSARAAALRTPAIVAIERLAKLAMAGTQAPRMVETARGIVQGWRAEHLPPGDLEARIETLRNDVDAGVMAAEDYVGGAETDGQRSAAQNQVDALTAVKLYLAEEAEETQPV